jgi:hypothetical protein
VKGIAVVDCDPLDYVIGLPEGVPTRGVELNSFRHIAFHIPKPLGRCI